MLDTPWSYSKNPLPRGYSYPVKRTDIDAAVLRASPTRLGAVYLMQWKIKSVLARADHLGDARSRRWAMEGLVTVRLFAVPSVERYRVENLLLNGGLDRLFTWVADAGDAGNSWRGGDHHFQLLQGETGLVDETDLWPR